MSMDQNLTSKESWLKSQWLRHLATVLAVSCVVMLTNLGGPRLWDRDEPRNANCAFEMLGRGDWIVPTFNAELRTHKPVLQYWSIMISYSLLGVSEFSARLPSAVYAILTAVLTWLMGRRLFGATAGLWAGCAIGSSLLFVMAGRACTPDATLIFWSTLSLAIYVLRTFPVATEQPATGRHPLFPDLLTAVLMYGAMGFAMLAKGPIGLIIPTACIGMFLLIETLQPLDLSHLVWWKRFPAQVWAVFHPVHFLKTCWYMNPVTALCVSLAIAMPWYVAVGIATDGEFLTGFFYDHNLSRATNAMEGHRGNVLFYPAAILVGMFPWSVIAIPLVMEVSARLRHRDGQSRSLVFAIAWVGVFIGLFTIAKTKLPSYITPCYPGAALLVGYVVDRWVRNDLLIAKFWPAIAAGVLVVVGIVLGAAVPAIAEEHLPGEEWLGILGLLPILTAAGGTVWAYQRQRLVAATWFAGGSALIVMSIFALGAQRADEHQRSHEILAAIFAQHEHPELASYRTLEPSWVFYAGMPVREYSPAAKSKKSEAETAARVIEHLEKSAGAYLITNRAGMQDLQGRLPADVVVLAERPLFLKNDRLFAIGRRRQETEAPAEVTAHVERIMAKQPPETFRY